MTSALVQAPSTGSDEATPQVEVGPRPARRLAPYLRPLAIYAASRAVTLIAFAGAAAVAGTYGDGLFGRSWPRVPPTGSLTLQALTTWDGAWYLDIARHGYPGAGAIDTTGRAFAFFPAYPLSIRGISSATGMPPALVGVLLAVLCGAVAAVLLWELARRLGGRAFADRAVVLFCFFPGSFVMSMAYSEPMMLAASLGCLLLLMQKRWWTAGLCGALATASRPNALVIIACCAWAAGRAIREDRRRLTPLAAPLLACSGVAAFYAYLWARTGDVLAWFHVQHELWNERFNLSRTATRAQGMFDHALSGRPQDLNELLPTLGLAFCLVALVLMWRWRPPAELWVYTAGVLLLALTSWNLGPRPRFVFTAFPLLMAVAWRARGTTFTVVVASSAVLLTALAFVTGLTVLAIP